MIPNYQVRFKDHSGQITHVLAGTGSSHGGISSIQFDNVVNGSGSHAIAIRGDIAIGLELGLDYQVEVWRMPMGSTTWVLAYEGFHRTYVWQADNAGGEQFISYGSGYNSLLTRRIIAAYATSAGSEKSGKAESVIKEYVNENLGPGAAVARQATGLVIQADGSSGDDWAGARSWDNLLEVCQDIANAGGGDFRIVGTGPATFEFRWYYGQMGLDRTLGNVAGNTPVVFSLQRNNMLTPLLSVNHGQEINTVYVLGPGEGLERFVLAVGDINAATASPWNRCEVSRQATNESTTDGLTAVGASELMVGQAQQSMTFEVAQDPACAFGIHYELGDVITALYHQQVDKKIVRASTSVDADRESIKLELADVHR